MKSHCPSPRHHQVLCYLSQMPRKIVAMHESDHTAEFVLHELALSGCFNLGKAAYFVDNPDFNCLVGIAGYDTHEHNGHATWASPEFAKHLPECAFNTKVRGVSRASCKRGNEALRALIADLAQELALQNPHCHTWEMKHDNQGVLLYEARDDADRELEEHLQESAHFLSFCPVV